MIGHNFYRTVLDHIAEEQVKRYPEKGTDEKAIRDLLYQIAIDTLQQKLNETASDRS